MADVNALNREFAKYDQVEKAHTYRLAEHEGDEFDDEYEIATLDIAPFLGGDAADKAHFAEAFGTALQEIGFAVLTGHGVDPALYDAMHDAVFDLFASTPLADKMRFRARALWVCQPGLFPDRGDQRYPSRPRRGMAVVPAGVRRSARSRPTLPGRGLLAARGI